MRALAFGTALSGLLWATIVWCGLAVQVATGDNRFHVSLHELGVTLLVLDLSFLTLLVWVIQQTATPWFSPRTDSRH